MLKAILSNAKCNAKAAQSLNKGEQQIILIRSEMFSNAKFNAR